MYPIYFALGFDFFPCFPCPAGKSATAQSSSRSAAQRASLAEKSMRAWAGLVEGSPR